jgi:hypothetical protein
MSFKDKIMNMVVAHPKLVTLGIGLAITFVVAPVIGLLEHGNLTNVYANGGSASHSSSRMGG